MRLRVDRQAHVALLDGAEEGIDLRERLDLVAEHFDAVGHVVVGGVDFDDVAAHTEGAAAEVAFGAFVEDLDQLAGDVLALDLLSFFEEQEHAVVGLRRAQAVDAADRGYDEGIATLEQGACGGKAELVEFVVDSRFFFDVEVRRRYVSFRLVVIIVRDEVLDGVMGEETLELVVELRGESLVVGHDEGGAVGCLNDLGHSEGLAGAGDTEQDLVLLAVEDAAGESFDGLALVTLGLVAAD